MRGLASWSSLSFLQNTAKNQSKYKSISNGEGEERMRTSIVVHEGFSQELKNRAPQLFVIVLFESLETANERLEKERHIRSHQTLRGQNLSLGRSLKRFIYLP